MTPATLLFERAGTPQQDGCTDHQARCVVCAQQSARTAVYDSWQGSTFTDQNKLRGHGLSDRVCEACIWAHSWVVPPGHPPPEPGKKGVNLRLFWHAWDAGSYVYGNKGDKAALRDFLRGPKTGLWFCAIADSGQKHTLPWTKINHAGSRVGVVRFEERDIVVGDWALVDLMTAALTAGVTKAEIETGTYGPRAWDLAEDLVRSLVERGRTEFGGSWWDLSVWLAQRDEAAVEKRLEDERAAKAAKKEGKRGPKAVEGTRAGEAPNSPARRASRVPRGRGEPAQALGPAPGSDACGGEVERGRRDVGHGVPQEAPPRGPVVEQLDLFGAAR